MKVYLAGKMDLEYGSWRDAILGTVYDYDAQRPMPRWEAVANNDLDDVVNGYVKPEWPKAPNRHVLRLHDYVGPYRLTHVRASESKWFGDFHGSSWKGQHGQMDPEEQQMIADECEAALRRADLVFAYINRPDCFGTLVEIGLARAFGKYVYVVFEDGAEWSWDDYWFVAFLADSEAQQWDVLGDNPPADPGERALAFFKDALIKWTGRPEQQRPLALVSQQPETALALVADAARSFSQIARWSADPRVRDEAQRMLKRIAG